MYGPNASSWAVTAVSRSKEWAAAALIYLCMSVQKQEKLSAAAAGPRPTLPITLNTWEDEWKR